MSAPRVSVIVTSCNDAGTVDECLASLEAQSGPPWEAILVDDGSTDGTTVFLRSVVRRDPRFRLVTYDRPHGGPSRARNAGLREASGRFACFLDADDVLLEGVLARGVELLRMAPEASLVFFDWEERDADGRLLVASGQARFRSLDRLGGRPLDGEAVLLPADRFYPALLRGNCIRVSSTIARRDMVLAVGGFDETLTNGDDYDLWLRLACRFPVIRCRLPGFRYRRRPGSISSSGESKMRNRVRVLERQWPEARRRGATAILRRRIAAAREALAWEERKAGNLAAARADYLRSLAAWPGPRALWGWISTWLPAHRSIRRRS